MIIAIDGPAGTGKGTIAKLISERLKFLYIDTGAMYRCIALKMLRQNIKLDDLNAINHLLDNTYISFEYSNDGEVVLLDGENVTKIIRTPDVNKIVSQVSSVPQIRIKLVAIQQEFGKNNNVVMEGRDITTVVFPNADVKIYLDARVEVRAERRYKELIANGNKVSYEETLENIKKRDYNDMHKEMGALKIAEDAVVVDTSDLNIEEVYKEVEKIINSVRREEQL